MSAPRLTATSAASGLLPIAIGGMQLTEVEAPQITSVAPFKGQETKLRSALSAWPKPNRAVNSVLWAGFGHAFVLGDCPDLNGLAAVTDQSDAWAQLVLEGAELESVLARLCPVDLSEMKRGHTARSLLGHMNALYWRVGARRMEIFVFRSMAATAVHEIERSMIGIAARARLSG